MSEKWDKHFLGLASYHSKISKDPSTRVGAVIVKDKEVLSLGFNGFPTGIADTNERLNDRELKYSLVVHGEMNAILLAARHGVRLEGTTLYVVATDVVTGSMWGGPPCSRCTVEVIQAGIKKIVSLRIDMANERWGKSMEKSLALLKEAGIEYVEYEGL
jgi:dCMP deaminase